MDGRPRKRTRKTFDNPTYLGSIEAQPFASYETVPIVTRSGVIRTKRVAQNLVPEAPPPHVEPEVEVDHEADAAGPCADDNVSVPEDIRDDVLGGMQLPRNGSLRKVHR